MRVRLCVDLIAPGAGTACFEFAVPSGNAPIRERKRIHPAVTVIGTPLGL
jgi:hypothetical protein